MRRWCGLCCGVSCAQCDGTWGLAVVSKDEPDDIVVACSGSPMVIGLGQDNIFVASEVRYIFLYFVSGIYMYISVV
jgi:glucosamine 6-phosphate synthetase-like amidotransferase/phosphosugar isomerase protein